MHRWAYYFDLRNFDPENSMRTTLGTTSYAKTSFAGELGLGTPGTERFAAPAQGGHNLPLMPATVIGYANDLAGDIEDQDQEPKI